MAYYAYSAIDPSLGEGPLFIRAGVDPANVERALAAIDHEIRTLGRDGPTAAELAQSQQYTDRIDSAQPRNQRRDCLVPRHVGAVRARPRLRSPPARTPASRDPRRSRRGRARAPRSREGGGRNRRPGRRLSDGRTGGILRRRLHADLSGADVPGQRLSRLLRAAMASPSTPMPSIAPSSARRRCSPLPATSTIPRSSSSTRGASSKAWAERGPGVAAAARDIYDQWAACHHFELYEDVPEVLRALHAEGLKIGLISNTERSLQSFATHFALEGLFAVAISSFEHGYMKPHPSIFESALQQIEVAAGRSGHGWRQRRARHRGRAPHRHARRPRLARQPAAPLPGRRAGDPLAARAARGVVMCGCPGRSTPAQALTIRYCPLPLPGARKKSTTR